MTDFEILEINDKRWDSYVRKCYIYDFHHTSCYHKTELKLQESSLLFVANSSTEHICLPLIIKAIPNSKFFDATSVYGYAGPIASKPFDELQPELIEFFKTKFFEFCVGSKIVSVFSRLHSLISQRDFFHNFGKIIDLNKTVAIDLTLSLEDQRRSFRKSNKSEINQLKGKKGYTFHKVDKKDVKSIQEFVNIYHDNMKRVNANPYYYFNLDYFMHLLTAPCFECALLIAKKNDVMAAGAIFTCTNAIMQYHLAGTREEYIQDTPMKLILDEARVIGTKKGMKYLHLGGGVGGSDTDSLFLFKSGFSKKYYQYSVWNLIINQKVYDSIVDQRVGLKQEDYPNFFPLYRAIDH